MALEGQPLAALRIADSVPESEGSSDRDEWQDVGVQVSLAIHIRALSLMPTLSRDLMSHDQLTETATIGMSEACKARTAITPARVK